MPVIQKESTESIATSAGDRHNSIALTIRKYDVCFIASVSSLRVALILRACPVECVST